MARRRSFRGRGRRRSSSRRRGGRRIRSYRGSRGGTRL